LAVKNNVSEHYCVEYQEEALKTMSEFFYQDYAEVIQRLRKEEGKNKKLSAKDRWKLLSEWMKQWIGQKEKEKKETQKETKTKHPQILLPHGIVKVIGEYMFPVKSEILSFLKEKEKRRMILF
jgi:DNA replication initiation complex subunit (GINS family)